MPKALPEKYFTRLRQLSNEGRYRECRAYIKKLLRSYPGDFRLLYADAVFHSEQTIGYSQRALDRRYRETAARLRKLLPRVPLEMEILRNSIRNEYYWFSKQPRKQYLLGLELVRKGWKRSHYSAGVGASQMAIQKMREGRRSSAIRWAKISEEHWLKFFEEDSRWYNSYLFYATALGVQGRTLEMERALRRGARIAKKSAKDPIFNKVRSDLRNALKKRG